PPGEDDTSFPPPSEDAESIRKTQPESGELPAAEPVVQLEPTASKPIPVQPVRDVLPTLKPWSDICAGVVLGGAIGDAMGHPTEFIGSISSIRAKYGPEGVTKFELFWDRNGKHFAPYTDDTQM